MSPNAVLESYLLLIRVFLLVIKLDSDLAMFLLDDGTSNSNHKVDGGLNREERRSMADTSIRTLEYSELSDMTL